MTIGFRNKKLFYPDDRSLPHKPSILLVHLRQRYRKRENFSLKNLKTPHVPHKNQEQAVIFSKLANEAES